jgi:tRNA-dihydrouridine synthase
VKHRIGINGRDSYAQLCDFVGTVKDAGCTSFTVHARIAILEGLSPKENRDIPPLRYDVAVGPVHHRGDGKSARHNLLIHRCFFLA